jgi:5-methylcytosine-specific restriction protein A
MTIHNPNWTRDELILALDLYFEIDFVHNRSDRNPKIEELSNLLNALPIHEAHFRNEYFRNPSGVYMKLNNFLRLDPRYPGKGLDAGSKLDEVVWNEFSSDLSKLRRTAQFIRDGSSLVSPSSAIEDSEDGAEFPEGKILTRIHNQRERNSTLTKKKKKKVLSSTGKLECEVCGFDFRAVYGDLGLGFAECHHIVPLSSLEPGHKTKLSDLAIVCANCHRMLHKSREWLSIEKLKGLIQS